MTECNGKNMDNYIHDLDLVIHDMKVSPKLLDIALETKKAIEACDIPLAAALSRAKSLTSFEPCDVGDPLSCNFWEEQNYNESLKVPMKSWDMGDEGADAQFILNVIHGDMARIEGRLPSNVVMLGGGRVEKRGSETIKHPLVDLVNAETWRIGGIIRPETCMRDRTVKELKMMCKTKGERGYSKMKKAELASACCAYSK